MLPASDCVTGMNFKNLRTNVSKSDGLVDEDEGEDSEGNGAILLGRLRSLGSVGFGQLLSRYKSVTIAPACSQLL